MMGLDLTGIGSIANLAESAINKIWPDKTEAEKNKFLLLTQELTQSFQVVVKQIEVNIEEAKHESVFVAGWRPAIGWVCGASLAYNYVLQPFLAWLLNVVGVVNNMPALDMGELMTLLLGMLGLGALRSYDKTKNGVAKSG